MTRFERRLAVTPETISDLTKETIAFLENHSVDSAAAFNTALIVEELLVNLNTHGEGQHQAAEVIITVGRDIIKGEIVDSGAPFDPRNALNPPPAGPIAERPVGGLGLHLVRQLACALDYRRDGGRNTTTFSVRRGRLRGDQG